MVAFAVNRASAIAPYGAAWVLAGGLSTKHPIGLFGTPGRNRTCDLRIRNPSLYPLSYGGFENEPFRM